MVLYICGIIATDMSVKHIVMGTAAVGILTLASYSIGRSTAPHSPITNPLQNSSEEYTLLAPRLFLDNPNDTRINFSGLRSSVRNYFSENDVSGTLYFEYLPTGTSIRVNGDERFTAASLMKLPVAMELFKAKELGVADLNQKVTLKQEWLNDGFGDLYKKGAGYELSLQELVEILLKDSDNTALRAIIETNDRVLGTNDRALGSLDIEYTLGNDQSIQIGSRSYSSFLKCLYFACYNNKEDSQAILNLLSETKFNNRIVSGIADPNVVIAHKIGVANVNWQSDCGIVYIPSSNYVLCIMLEGTDNDAINAHFAALSKLAYEFVLTK